MSDFEFLKQTKMMALDLALQRTALTKRIDALRALVKVLEPDDAKFVPRPREPLPADDPNATRLEDYEPGASEEYVLAALRKAVSTPRSR